jgi:phospholipase/carboxylesterase
MGVRVAGSHPLDAKQVAMPDIVHTPQAGRPSLLLLHGRGGTEHDLVGLAQAVAPGWGIIAPRGPEAEGGGFAWFRHHAIGIPVDESLDSRLAETAERVHDLAAGAGIAVPLVAVGFSNGGMMAGALGATHPELVSAVVLLSSTYPLPPAVGMAGGLQDMPVLALAGGSDPFLPPPVHEAGVRAYGDAGAVMTAFVAEDGGHGVAAEHAAELRKWLETVESG